MQHMNATYVRTYVLIINILLLGSPIRMAYVGKCCDPIAPNVTYEEIANITPENLVCGNDGKNYTNNWSLFAAATKIMGKFYPSYDIF